MLVAPKAFAATNFQDESTVRKIEGEKALERFRSTSRAELGIAFALKRNTLSCMPTVTVKLSQPEFSKLEAMAAASKRTKSDVLRDALAKSGSTSASLLDAMRPYIGKLSGPGDLSTNKSRMKHYGASRSR